jgi:hypothetical protein
MRLNPTLFIATPACLALYIFLNYPATKERLEDFKYNLHSSWINYKESGNALNRFDKLSDRNMDILLSTMEQGLVIPDDSPTALHIEIDKQDRFSIHNASMSESILDTILKNRMTKIGAEFPCYIWADRRSSEKTQTNLIAKLQGLKLSPIYRVGIRQKSNHKGIDYVVTPCAPIIQTPSVK